MRLYQMILSEMAYRWVNAVFSLVGVALAVTLFVFFFTANEASRKETSRITRDIGLNLRILPKATDMTSFWIEGYSGETMPVDYVHELASHTGLDYAHLLATLRRKIEWSGRQVMLVGRLPEISPVGHKKPTMSLEPGEGTVLVGYQLARELDIKPDQNVDVLGRSLTVAGTLPESGTIQDNSLIAHLNDVQAALELPGQINEIQAINCVCFDDNHDALTALREQLAVVLPEAKVIQMRAMAEARLKQRRMIEDYIAVIVPFALVICAGWVGLLAMLNVRERRQEIGTLRALGFGSVRIGSLFLGKAIVIGLVGAAIGFGVGTALAESLGPPVFRVTGKSIKPIFDLLGWSLVLAPLFAAVAACIPTMIAVTQDPAESLRVE